MKNFNLFTYNASNKFFLIAFGLLNVLAFTLLLCGLSLIAGLTISKWQFPAGIVLALIASYYAANFFIKEKANHFFLKSSVGILGCIIGAILFCGYFYDVSYDGQWYHQETVYQLKNGYNPAYQVLAAPPNETGNNDCPVWCTGIDRPASNLATPVKHSTNLKFIALNYLCKGSEIIAASIYQVTNHIETAKAVNSIILLASFFLCLSLLYKFESISVKKKWLLAVLFAFNPVAVMQLLTFYVDGNVSGLLLCVLAISCLLFIEVNSFYLFALASVIILVVSVKLTGLAYTGMYCSGFLVILLVYKKIETFRKVFIAGLFSAIIGISCCGFNPYITNITHKHTLFYGFDETRTEILRTTPPGFRNADRFKNLFLSVSSHQWSYPTDSMPVQKIFKIPFTFNSRDILAANDPAQEVSGFGPFFSGALLIAIILFITALAGSKTTGTFKFFGASILIILSTVWITPYAWWARFVPQFWMIPVIIVFMAECIFIKRLQLLKNMLYLSLALSVAWALLSIVFNIFSTARVNFELQQLKALNKPVNVEYCTFQDFKSNRVRFEEWGIKIIEKKLTGPYVYNMAGSNTRYETPVALPEPPKPFLLQLTDKIKGK